MNQYNKDGYNQYGLKMDLQELRDSIDINKKIWKHTLSTNCYAYALGLDIKEKDIREFAYTPGMLAYSKGLSQLQQHFTYSNLLENFYEDLNFLGIEFKEVDPFEELSDNEWKVALFISQYDLFNQLLNDFHFLRQTETGIWYHKEGWYKKPTNIDNNSEIITDPRECYLKGRDYKKCYSLKLKK